MESFKKRRSFVQCLLVLMSVGLASSGLAQDKYPSRPIDFIVPYGPGGGADQVARKLAGLLETELKVSVPILNIPGASGNTGITKLLTSPAEGYSIALLVSNAFAQFAMTPPAWKLEDIVFLGRVSLEPSGFFVTQNARWKTWDDVEKETKAKPRTLKVAGTGVGSSDELTTRYFASKGLSFVFVPYAKASERYVAVLGGHADIIYEQLGELKTYLQNNQMRPLLFFSDKRLAGFKDTPVSKEVGYDIALPQYRVIVTKKGTDPARMKVLSAALSKAATSSQFTTYLREQLNSEDSYMAPMPTETFVREQIETSRKYVQR